MIKKILLIFVVFTSFIFSQTAGNAGLSFLKNGISAYAISSSDIGMLNDNLSSIYYNPASVNFQSAPSISFTHQAWIQDLNSEILNASFSMFGLPFAIGVNTTSIEGFEARTNSTVIPDATFNVNYFYTGISTGFKIYKELAIGFTLKYLYESLLSDDASGTGYDFGLIYSRIWKNLNVGASVRNIGSMKKLRNEQTKLPSDFIVNATYGLNFQNVSLSFLPVVGIQKYFESDDMHVHVGTEVTYDKLFSLRVGYITGYESKGLTVGAGVLWHGFNFNYALTPFSFGIGSANTISLMYTF